MKYVLDGHHRLAAARQVGLSEVPYESVPFEQLGQYGYGSVDELLIAASEAFGEMNEAIQESAMLHLVRRYIATVMRLATQLRGELGAYDLLGAVNSRVLPRAGHLKDGASYHFHGVGCSVETSTFFVDFDFGPNGRVDGFDAWRLRAFAEQSPDDGQFHDLNVVEAGLRDLEEQWIIKKPGWAPSPHLYYLSDSVAYPQQPG